MNMHNDAKKNRVMKIVNVLLATVALWSIAVEARYFVCIDSQALFYVDQNKLKKTVPWSTAISGVIDAFFHPSLNPIEAAEQRFWKKLEDEWGRQVGPEMMLVRDQDGKRVLPWLMVEWFKGEVTGEQAIEMIRRRSASFITEVASVAFNAKLLADNVNVVSGAMHFLERCAEQSELFMLGNWHLEVFNRVASNPNVIQALSLIPADHRYISGCMKLVLPCDIAQMLSVIGYNTQQPVDQIIFVTNMAYHAQVAQSKGIKTVLIINNDFDTAYRMVKSHINK